MTSATLKEPVKSRITSIDLFKGIIMVVMALDHIRDYFHYSAYQFDAYDLHKAGTFLFVTRWVTHFCAPAFSLLAGTSAFLSSQRKTTADISRHLFIRGLWLVVVECTLVTFGWCFDPKFRFISLGTFWSLGVSMMVLSALVYLPYKAILTFVSVLVLAHNAFDKMHFDGNINWVFLHDGFVYNLDATHRLEVLYPLIPWIGVMALGYCLGGLFRPVVSPAYRKRLLNIMGVSALALFVILRSGNFYGDHIQWTVMETPTKTLLSFIQVEKYPPSLQYLMITLGPCLLFLANFENVKGAWVNFFIIFGRVPFFYYILHIYLLHALALLAAQLTGFSWKSMILTLWINDEPRLKGFGFNILAVYMIWLIVVFTLYPLCRWFANYKFIRKDKKWLSYL